MKFLKKILGVNPQTPNFAVNGELGRYPMSLLALAKSIIYCLCHLFIQYLMKITKFFEKVELVLNGLQKLKKH